jgi:transposase
MVDRASSPQVQGRDPSPVCHKEVDVFKSFVGVDVSSQWFDVAVTPGPSSSQFPYTEDGIAAFLSWLARLDVGLVVMEACGHLERPLTRALQEADVPVAVVNPRNVRHFARSIGQLAKTDALDARVLAQYAASIRPQPRPLPDPEEESLQALVTRRRQLVGMLAAEKNRLRRANPELVPGINRHLQWLQDEITLLNKQIAQRQKDHPLWRERKRVLESSPGVAGTTSAALTAYLPELGQLDRKKIAALVGVAPLNRDSGQQQGTRSIWGGRREVRTALYMCTLASIRCNPVIRDFYNQLRARGKKPKVALVACMRKILVTLNAMVRDGTEWHPQLSSP